LADKQQTANEMYISPAKTFVNPQKYFSKRNRTTAILTLNTIFTKTSIGNHLNDLDTTIDKSPATKNSLAKAGVQCSADTFVVNQNLILRINP
jgi:hypothetical protein